MKLSSQFLSLSLFVGALIFICSRCTREDEQSAKTVYLDKRYGIVLEDKSLDSLISKYIAVNKVDVHERLLVIRFYNDGIRQFYYITQARQKVFTTDQPDYYFINEDNAVVLLFLGGHKFFSSYGIKTELDEVIKEYDLSLANDGQDFNPPLWEVLRNCDSNLEVRTRVGSFILDYLPCGYSIKQDSLIQNEYELIRK